MAFLGGTGRRLKKIKALLTTRPQRIEKEPTWDGHQNQSKVGSYDSAYEGL